MTNFVIFGDSPFAERLAKYILKEGKDNLLGFTQEDEYCKGGNILGCPVIPLSRLRDSLLESFEVLIAIGYTKMNDLREKIYTLLVREGFNIGTWISVSASVYADDIGEGTIILPNVMIGPGCKIGKCNFFAASSVLSHDNKVNDYNFISTGVVVGGGATISNHCFLGLNSTIRHDIILNDYTLLGSACNMLKDSDNYGAYIGNPAKILAKSSLELVI